MYDTPSNFVRKADEHERVRLYYHSVYSDSVQHVEGNARESDSTRWTKVVSDSGSEYTVFGQGLHSRDPGTISKNGRQIGEFERVESI